MKQVFYHYTQWEDYQNGMYNEQKEGRAHRVKLAVCLLSDPVELYKNMKRVTEEWKHATEQVLTDMSVNHQAFLGQAACNIWSGIKEDETREAWGMLTNEQRNKANAIADMVDEEWRRKYTNLYQPSLFEVTDEK